jgi:hypothetical protein
MVPGGMRAAACDGTTTAMPWVAYLPGLQEYLAANQHIDSADIEPIVN